MNKTKKEKQILRTIGKSVGISFELLISFINALITFTLLSGSVAAITLLYKLYPEIFITSLLVLLPLITILWKIIIILLWIFTILVLAYIIYFSIITMNNILKKSKKKREQRREIFLNDLVDKLKKKLKKK